MEVTRERVPARNKSLGADREGGGISSASKCPICFSSQGGGCSDDSARWVRLCQRLLFGFLQHHDETANARACLHGYWRDVPARFILLSRCFRAGRWWWWNYFFFFGSCINTTRHHFITKEHKHSPVLDGKVRKQWKFLSCMDDFRLETLFFRLSGIMRPILPPCTQAKKTGPWNLSEGFIVSSTCLSLFCFGDPGQTNKAWAWPGLTETLLFYVRTKDPKSKTGGRWDLTATRWAFSSAPPPAALGPGLMESELYFLTTGWMILLGQTGVLHLRETVKSPLHPEFWATCPNSARTFSSLCVAWKHFKGSIWLSERLTP